MTWQKVKLGDIVEDLTEQRKIIIKDEEEITEPTINTKEHKILVSSIKKGRELKIKKRVLIKKGDLVFSKLHTQNGAFAFSNNEFKSTTTFLPLLIKEEKINKDFLFWILHINVPKLTSSDTVGRETYKTRDILNIKFYLPKLDKQKEIIKKFILEKDNILDLKNSFEYNLKYISKLRQSILQEAVQGKLVPQDPKDEPASELLKKIKIKSKISLSNLIDPMKKELPSGWIWIKFEDIMDYSKKYPMKRGPFGSAITKSIFVPKGKDTYKVYEQKNAIYNDATIGHYYINKSNFERLKAFEVKGEDVIISCSGTIGKVGFMPKNIEPGIINQALLKLCINDEIIIKRYFSFLFEAFVMQTDKLTELKGTAIKNIPSMNILKNMLIPLPPLFEQKRIVEKVDKLMAYCDKLEKQVKENQKNAEKLMEAVLKESFEQ